MTLSTLLTCKSRASSMIADSCTATDRHGVKPHWCGARIDRLVLVRACSMVKESLESHLPGVAGIPGIPGISSWFLTEVQSEFTITLAPFTSAFTWNG